MHSGIAALAAGIPSFGLVIPHMSQVWFTGPIAKTTADVGFAFSAVLCLPFRLLEIIILGHVKYICARHAWVCSPSIPRIFALAHARSRCQYVPVGDENIFQSLFKVVLSQTLFKLYITQTLPKRLSALLRAFVSSSSRCILTLIVTCKLRQRCLRQIPI